MKTHLNPFKDSLYATVRGVDLKSCPRCSRAEGRPVFYPVESFGTREDKGTLRVQTWCGPCRSVSSKKGGAA